MSPTMRLTSGSERLASLRVKRRLTFEGLTAGAEEDDGRRGAGMACCLSSRAVERSAVQSTVRPRIADPSENARARARVKQPFLSQNSERPLLLNCAVGRCAGPLRLLGQRDYDTRPGAVNHSLKVLSANHVPVP